MRFQIKFYRRTRFLQNFTKADKIGILMSPFYVLFNKLLKLEEEDIDSRDSDQCHLGETHASGMPCFTGRCHNSSLPRFQFVDVPHIRQIYTWDCGLACVLMVLRTLGIDHCDLHSLQKLCCTRSIWTVDLAYLLHSFSISFSFFTVTLGANPDFSAETFYKEQLSDDEIRVNGLFNKAMETGIMIQQSSISGQYISALILTGHYIAIALVDKCKLSCSWLEDIYFSGCSGGYSGYTGHYVVICGYDANTQEFEIRDPSSSRKNERVSMERLEKARRSFGTDEDILLVSLEKAEGESNTSV